MDISF